MFCITNLLTMLFQLKVSGEVEADDTLIDGLDPADACLVPAESLPVPADLSLLRLCPVIV